MVLFWFFSCSTAVDPEIIARGTVGFSGAELENLVNQAALKAAVDGKDMVTMKELEFSKDKILMGRILYERHTSILQDTELFLCDEDFYREIEKFLWWCFLDCCSVVLVGFFFFCLVWLFYLGSWGRIFWLVGCFLVFVFFF